MSNRSWWKLEIAVIALVLLAVAGWLFVRVPEVIESINRKYPSLGIVGWSLIVLWLVGGVVAVEATTRLCKKRKWSQFCYTEGMAAGALYMFFSSVLFLLLVGKP